MDRQRKFNLPQLAWHVIYGSILVPLWAHTHHERGSPQFLYKGFIPFPLAFFPVEKDLSRPLFVVS